MNLNELKKQVEAYPPEVRLLIRLSTPGGPDGPTLEKWLADNPINWQRFAALATSHKLVSMIFPSLSFIQDHIPEATYRQLKNQNQRFTRRSFVQTEQTIHLQELFNQEGIPALFFKGIVLSQRLYGHPLHYLETFTDPGRFAGTCYRAANWRPLGLTTGRGNNDRSNKPNRSLKLVWGYPLTPRFRERLQGGAP